jgi:hypothetical protein
MPSRYYLDYNIPLHLHILLLEGSLIMCLFTSSDVPTKIGVCSSARCSMVGLLGSALDSAELDSEFIRCIITALCIVRFWIWGTIRVTVDARKVY